MDWLEQAAKLNSEWMTVQKKMVDTLMQNQDQATSSGASAETNSGFPNMDGVAQMSEFNERIMSQYVKFMTPVKQKSVDDYMSEANKALYENYQAAWGKTQSMWSDMGGEMPNAFNETMASAMGPQAWWSKLFDPAQFQGLKMTELPSFAGLTNYDTKVATAVDEWQDLQKEISNYAYVVMKAWLEAHTRFQGELEEVMKSEDGTKGWREVMDFWQQTADKTLMEMHRSEDFLKAQKGLIEASAAYRMAEQTVADETNKAMHIPTRSEIDELHKKVYELSKELRALKKEMRGLVESSAPKTAPARKAGPKKAPAARRKPAAKSTGVNK